jgi:transcriptional regulator with XRE-family HTH domain
VLGETLRKRRLERGLELEDAAAALGVPAKSLRALEWERPDLLGDGPEADNLQLRYAAFLGLAVEGLTRATRAEPPAAPPAQPRLVSRRVVWLPVAAALAPAVVIGAVYLIGKAGDEESAAQVDRQPRASSVAGAPPPGVTVIEEDPTPSTPAERRVDLVLSADRGASWVEAHVGSRAGPLLYEGNLEQGNELRFAGRRIWLRLGAATNVSLALNGRRSDTPLFGTVSVVVTPNGIEPVG